MYAGASVLNVRDFWCLLRVLFGNGELQFDQLVAVGGVFRADDVGEEVVEVIIVEETGVWDLMLMVECEMGFVWAMSHGGRREEGEGRREDRSRCLPRASTYLQSVVSLSRFARSFSIRLVLMLVMMFWWMVGFCDEVVKSRWKRGRQDGTDGHVNERHVGEEGMPKDGLPNSVPRRTKLI